MKQLTKNQKIAILIGSILLVGGIGYLVWQRRKSKDDKKIPNIPNEQRVLKDVFDNLTFETNKDVIKPDSFPFLDELAQTMKDAPNWTLKIIGHTDNVGKVANNLELSMRRANSVKKYLVGKGVLETMITAEGRGETQPLTTNDSEEGRAKNRRVEFVITKPDNTVTTTIV